MTLGPAARRGPATVSLAVVRHGSPGPPGARPSHTASGSPGLRVSHDAEPESHTGPGNPPPRQHRGRRRRPRSQPQ